MNIYPEFALNEQLVYYVHYTILLMHQISNCFDLHQMLKYQIQFFLKNSDTFPCI